MVSSFVFKVIITFLFNTSHKVTTKSCNDPLAKIDPQLLNANDFYESVSFKVIISFFVYTSHNLIVSSNDALANIDPLLLNTIDRILN